MKYKTELIYLNPEYINSLVIYGADVQSVFLVYLGLPPILALKPASLCTFINTKPQEWDLLPSKL